MSTSSSSRLFLSLACAAALLTGCSDIREDLGLGRKSPNEFAVVERPPLSIPPDFSLRPPRPGAPRPQEATPAAPTNASLTNNSNPAVADDKSATVDAAAEAARLNKSQADGKPVTTGDAPVAEKDDSGWFGW